MVHYKWMGAKEIPNTLYTALLFEISGGEGRTFSGHLKTENSTAGKQEFEWRATYGGEGRWEVLPTKTPVGVVAAGAFARDPFLNRAIKFFIAGELISWRQGASVVRAGSPRLPAHPPDDRGEKPEPPKEEKPAAKEAEKELPQEKVERAQAEEKRPEPSERKEREKPEVSKPQETKRAETIPALAVTGNGGEYIVRAKVSRIRRFEEQPREYFDEEDLAKPADSLKQDGLNDLPTVVPVAGDPEHEYELVNGERRWRAAQLADIAEINVRVNPNIRNKDEQHLAAVILNFNHVVHTPMEISNALQRQIDAGKSGPELAIALGQSIAWVYQHLALQKLAPPLQTLLGPPTPRRERIRMQVVHQLVRVPLEEQEALYIKIIAEKHPKRQNILAQELVEARVGVSRQKMRVHKPSDEIEWLNAFAPRLDADTHRLLKFTTSVYQTLVRHRSEEEIETVLAAFKKASEAFAAFEKEVGRMRGVILNT